MALVSRFSENALWRVPSERVFCCFACFLVFSVFRFQNRPPLFFSVCEPNMFCCFLCPNVFCCLVESAFAIVQFERACAEGAAACVPAWWCVASGVRGMGVPSETHCRSVIARMPESDVRGSGH